MSLLKVLNTGRSLSLFIASMWLLKLSLGKAVSWTPTGLAKCHERSCRSVGCRRAFHLAQRYSKAEQRPDGEISRLRSSTPVLYWLVSPRTGRGRGTEIADTPDWTWKKELIGRLGPSNLDSHPGDA